MNPHTDPDLAAKASDAILQRIIEFAPQMKSAPGLATLAEAYALATGTLTSKGGDVTVSK